MSAERLTVDTNLLVYVIDRSDLERQRMATTVVGAARQTDCWLTYQALSEFFSVATRKFRMPPSFASHRVLDWLQIFPTAATSRKSLASAMEASSNGRFSFWDALLLASAEEAGCTVALSEDMADGASLGNIRVVNPFVPNGLSLDARKLLDLP
jgi:predicted nucleic acid-binding protein